MRSSARTSAWVAATVLVAVAVSGCLDPLVRAPQAPYDLLTSDRYTRLVVEIDYAQGFAPSASAVDLLRQRIGAHLDKPGGVEVVQQAFQPTKDTYSTADMRALRDRVQSHHPGGDTMVLHVLYLNGRSADDPPEGRILGVHYGPASIAVFKESIQRSGGVLGGLSGASIERAVLVHEFGHAIGLVNNGIPMTTPREHQEYPGHSTNRDSVMYWAVERGWALDVFGTSIPNDFDAHDKQDIRNAGGR